MLISPNSEFLYIYIYIHVYRPIHIFHLISVSGGPYKGQNDENYEIDGRPHRTTGGPE